MKHLLLLALLASPALAQTSVATGGTQVVGQSSGTGTGSIAGGTCQSPKVQTGLNADGTPICSVIAGSQVGSGYDFNNLINAPAPTIVDATGSVVCTPTGVANHEQCNALSTPANVPNTAVSRDNNGAGSVDVNGISTADHANTGSGTGSNGIASAWAACGSLTCVVQVSKAYPFDAERDIGFTGPNQVLIDQRGGSQWTRTNDVTPGANFRENITFYDECNTHLTPSSPYVNVPNGIGDCRRVQANITAPGYNNGSYNSQYSGWPVTHTLQLRMVHQGQGIKAPLSSDTYVTGPGDMNRYDYMHTHGGNGREPAAEGAELYAGQLLEETTYYSGTTTSKPVADVLKTSSGGVTGSFQDLGAGMRITKTNALISSGYVTAAGSDPLGYELLTISGGGLTPSRWCGTLDAAVDPPTLPSTGPSSPVSTSTSFNVTLASGCGSGVPTVGDRFGMGLPSVEGNDLITAASQTSPGHWHVTANIRLYHTTGAYVYQWDMGRVGFSFNANTATTYTGSRLQYDLEAIGALDATHPVVLEVKAGISSQFNFGKVLLGQTALDSSTALSNTGGVVTVTVTAGGFFQQHPAIYNAPGITISGATNSAFNGYCANVRNISTAFPPTFQCDQAASTGQTSAANGTAVFAIGDTPYGNTEYTMAQTAQVIDIQNYGVSPPVVDGTLRLEPNSDTFFAVGDALAMNHDYVERMALSQTLIQNYNPYHFDSTGHQTIVQGTSANGNLRMGDYTNTIPASNYAGYGGTESAPTGFVLRGPGPWATYGGMDNAPGVNGNFLSVGCPLAPWSCTRPDYNYNALSLMSGLGYPGTLNYTPYNNTLAVGMHLKQSLSSETVIPLTSADNTFHLDFSANDTNIVTLDGDHFIMFPPQAVGGQTATLFVCQTNGVHPVYLTLNIRGTIQPGTTTGTCSPTLVKYSQILGNWFVLPGTNE